ncbi:adenine phosphoribosyltransferase [archaeon]|jgi:adenine phosphoribosyltransferase|nr:adenine phosphoribosyltransferase [archaeon]MBT3730698.1 adenine phosphoribosyltransferase [archaeon]MBT4669600.1 adenine phosphoribosyltransferase [archaeon]MBT5030357.1 adenine phosphoribosyltransferase [archaeon]MBT5288350.1 adenine phosphoribosyltransferase [archaeon]
MENLINKIRTVPDFPKEGINFKDITPLLLDPKSIRNLIRYFEIRYKGRKIDKIAAVESRGFIIGAMLAQTLGKGFIPIRKPNKLPFETERIEYSLEYGTDGLEIHKDSIKPGERILLVDDVLATGGTAKAAAQLVERLGGDLIEIAFMLSINKLNGKDQIKEYDSFTLLEFEE